MLGDATVYPTIAVRDLEEGRSFYEDTLGLEKASENPAGILYKSGDGYIFIYPSDTAGTNKATNANWVVDNIKDMVRQLKAKGVTFEQYQDLPGIDRIEEDVHIGSDDNGNEMQAAWFKDPSGNILCISTDMRQQ